MRDGEYEGMVRKNAKRYGWALNQCGLDWEDLWQVGRMGVQEAFRKHDPERGPLEPYVQRCIRHSQLREAQMNGHCVKVSRQDSYRTWKSGGSLKVPRVPIGPRDTPDGSIACVLDRKGKVSGPSVDEDQLHALRESHALMQAIARLKPKWKAIIEARFIDGTTLEVAGARVGVTRERARQIEESAIRELGKWMRRMGYARR